MAKDIEFKGKGQALRLGLQQELGGGPLGIFGAAAQKHDLSIREVSAGVLAQLTRDFPNLEFRQRIVGPTGRVIFVTHNSGMLNRIDRVTASSFGCKINENYCENIKVTAGGTNHMLQIASLYFQARPWEAGKMGAIMLDIAKTSIKVIGADLA